MSHDPAPDPKDPKYNDRVNLFIKDSLRWQARQRPAPVEMPPDLEEFFTPESVAEAKAKRSGD